jgi:hypothetical protein
MTVTVHIPQSVENRQRIDAVAVDDPVTCDLHVQVAATLEKQLWMIRAQTPPDREPAVPGADRSRTDSANGSDPS